MGFQSLSAAVLIPRDEGGSVDEAAFRASLEFLLARGIRGVVLNGATGEYCSTTAEEIARLAAICRDTLDGRGEWMCGIGSASFAGGAALAKIALERGAAAVLLPMPHFFPYSQDDLRCYCAEMAASVPAPVLLYNLPRFTTPIEPATVVELVESVPNIAGIKDSSGTLDIFGALEGRGACRLVGDDSVLVKALDAGLCEGVVSGVAGVLPELTRFLCCARGDAAYPEAARLLTELIARLSAFPTPWGLKLVADCRGLASARFLQPLSPARQRQAREFREWFGPWWTAAASWLGDASRAGESACATSHRETRREPSL